MPRYQIRGVEVDFPFDAYDCQLVYMEKVITALQQKTNAILESPTGTGKTLCLLCATLAWRKARLALAQFANATHRPVSEMDDGGVADPRAAAELEAKLKQAVGWAPTGSGRFDQRASAIAAVPRVIYASRTHTQLSQTIKELKATGYVPKVCVLASREHLCINTEVQQVESNAAKTALCRAKTSSRSCSNQIKLEETRIDRATAPRQIRDIEDLIQYGMETRACPYYLAREDQDEAEITVLPYNYLFDTTMRRAQKIDVSNAIVIVDEAHNLEKHAEETASFDLTPIVLANCIDDVDKVMALDDSMFGGEDQVTREDLAVLKTILLDLEEHLGKVDLGRNAQEGKAFPGEFIYTLLGQASLTFDTSDQVQTVIGRLVAILTSSPSAGKQSRGRTALSTLADILRTVFSPEMRGRQAAGVSVTQHYRVYVKEVSPTAGKRRTKGGKSAEWGDVDAAQPAVGTAKPRTLSFWCFNPGIAIREFEAHGTHSIILTSGTLHPLDSFAAELSIKLPVRLQNSHVISSNQLWVGVVQKGPGGHRLNSSYATRSDPAYQRDLGNAIVNFCRIVPNGVLVFFPSYGVMRDCVGTWQGGEPGKTVWDRIRQYKAAVIEPQDKHEFSAAMSEFYSRVSDPRTKGAVFFAVCRGKVSEGLDFANENGRAVIITGQPYPPYKDPRVVLKREHCDRESRGSAGGLNGSNWYHQQSARAVNQAIGRVIRHRHDYGAIIFCDERFASPKSIEQLPAWIQPSVKVCEKFGESQGAVTKFFKELARDSVLRDATAKLSKQGSPKQNSEGRIPKSSDGEISSVPRSRPSGNRPQHHIQIEVESASPAIALTSEGTSSSGSIQSRPRPPKVGLLQSLSEQDRNQAAKVMGTLKRISIPTSSAQTSRQSGPDSSETAASGRGRSGKRRRALYSDSSETQTQKPTVEDSTKEKSEKFTKRLRALLGKDGTRRWQTLLMAFTQSAKKLPDMEALIIAARLLFRPFGSTTERELLHDLRVVFSRKPKLLVLYDKAMGSTPAEEHTSDLGTQTRTKRGIVAIGAQCDPSTAHACESGRNKMLRVEPDAVKSDTTSSVAHSMQPPIAATLCRSCSSKAKTPFRSKACGHVCCYLCWIAARERNGSLCPDPDCKVRFHKKDMEKLYFS